jgi:hypothetical protein
MLNILRIGMMKRCPIILIDRFFNAGVVGFRGSNQPTGRNPTQGGFIHRKKNEDRLRDFPKINSSERVR